MSSQEELVDLIIKASERLDSESPALDRLASYLYIIADPKINEYIAKFNQLLEIKSPKKSQLQERGKILEQIVYLVFRSLKGVTSLKSF